MPATQVTNSTTEADFEARIDAAIRLAFPLLPRNTISHQTTFFFSFGGKEITVDGKSKNTAQARADIILRFRDKPLAVLELKRPGISLSEDDLSQGISYARILNPMAPLVVVSNGQAVRIIETHTSKEWQPSKPSEETISGLIQTAARVAANDLKTAVSTLMATNPEVWVQAVRKTTTSIIAELSGGWTDRLQSFVKDFLIPRKATKAVKDLLRGGSKLVIVEGSPLSGKSNVLRELVQDTQEDSDLVVFFIESEGRASSLRQISDILAQELDWPVSQEETRTWLKHLSNSDGPKLVIAIDGIGSDFDNSRDEIIDLTSTVFGPKLALVVELDDTVADAAVHRGRKASRIGRLSRRVFVRTLDDEEFLSACNLLSERRVEMMHGAKLSKEFRSPWVLRAATSHIVRQPKHGDPHVAGGIPPLLSLGLIGLARGSFNYKARETFQAIATAALEDAMDVKRPISLILESAETYVVRKKTLKKQLSESDITDVVDHGFLKSIIHKSGEPLLVALIPELVASEASVVLARQLIQRARQSSEKTAIWISRIAANLPLGDIVAAHAFIDAAKLDQGIPLDVIASLMGCSPRKEVLKEGSKFAVHMPETGTLHLTTRANGYTVRTTRGNELFIPFDPEDATATFYADVHSWLILSHLAGIPLAAVNEKDNEDIQRIDPYILMKVGKCPMVLRRPSADPDMNIIPEHDFQDHGSIVCHKAGIVEPITLSIFNFLCGEANGAEEWVKAAVASNSLPLLARLDIALRAASEMADENISQFAQAALDNWISPAMSVFLPKH